MFYWSAALLAVDMVLMAGILYMFLGRRGLKESALQSSMAQGGLSDEACLELIDNLREELVTARTVSSELDEQRLSLKGYEKSLSGRQKELEELIRKVRESAFASPAGSAGKDVYQRANMMVNNGAPVDEVTDMLGLLNGEAELLSSLSNYRA